MESLSAWQSRVIERSLGRAAASARDRRSPASVAKRALRPSAEIVQAAFELAEERGVAPFTVQDVLVRANVSLQTFYRHFSGKDELLLAVIEESVSARIAEFRQRVVRLRDPVARLERFVKGPFSRGADSPLSHLIVREHLRLMEDYAREVRAADDPYRELVKETIQEAQAVGRFPEIDAEQESETIMALVVARFHNLALGVLGHSAAKEGEHIWEFCLGALTRWEGRDGANATSRRPARHARSSGDGSAGARKKS